MKKNSTTTTAPEGKQDTGYEVSDLKLGGYYQLTDKNNIGEIIADVHASSKYSGRVMAEFLASAPTLKSENEKLKEDVKELAEGYNKYFNKSSELSQENKKLKEDKRDLLSIIQWVIDLTPAQFHHDNLKSVKDVLKKSTNKHQ